jgi:hypothetical protein
MAIGRAERFEERKPRVIAAFGDDNETILAVSHVFELMEMAWHDCYAEVTPSEEVVDNVLLCSRGTLGGLIHACPDSRTPTRARSKHFRARTARR